MHTATQRFNDMNKHTHIPSVVKDGRYNCRNELKIRNA